jgi:plasmid stabilization system protein ParE
VVVLAPAASDQIRSALTWWAQNRPTAPHLLATELDHVLVLLSAAPEIGARARTKRFGLLHRMLLPRTRYHLYYRIATEPREVQVLLFRHAQRRPT